MKHIKTGLFLIAMLCQLASAFAQDSTAKESPALDSAAKELFLSVGYYAENNHLIYLKVATKTKVEGKFLPVASSQVILYLDRENDSLAIDTVLTDRKGMAKVAIPISLQAAWKESPHHTIIGVCAADKGYPEARSETTVTVAKISIDTLTNEEGRSIVAQVLSKVDDAWVPVPGVELRIGIRRLGSVLTAGDDETVTTDSTGTVTVLFKKDSLPGDSKGNLVLVASVTDNDDYGNLEVEKTVPWGSAFFAEKGFFNQRTLWSTRFRTPWWLLFMAYSIALTVWGILIYLVIQIVRIKKIGDENPVTPLPIVVQPT